MTRLGAAPVRVDDVPLSRRDDRRAVESARTAHRRDLLLRRGAPIAALVVAAIARLWNLGFPKALVFDETFYVKDAWTLWHRGYEATWPSTFTDQLFAAGRVNLYTTDPEYVAHPPLGKWIIGLGEVLAGGAQNSYGWRLGTAVAGILAVALVMVLAHRLFATPLVTAVAGGLFAIDNQAIVLSRVALLDDFVMLFALVAVVCLVEDRFWAERRMGVWLLDRAGPGGWGPAMVWRPWLIAAGLATGFCCAVKWSGIYFLVFFVAYSLLVDMMLRRRAGVRFWYSATLLKQGWATLVSLLPTFLIAYLVSWSGWFATTGGYDRQYVQDGGHRFTGVFSWVPVVFQNLWAWHASIYEFHVTLDSSHPYNAPARLWLLIARPTSMWWDTALFQGKQGCPAGQCTGAITDLPNPLIWYAAVAASIYLLVRFIRRHEWQAGLLLMGLAAGYLPWLLYPNRTMFFFYTIAFEPYLILCLAATIGLLVVAPAAPADRFDEAAIRDGSRGVRVRRGVVIGFLSLAVVVSAFYYPLSTGIPEPYWLWHIHMWSPTWI